MSRNGTRNGEDEIEKAKAIGEFYGTSEYSKSILKEEKKTILLKESTGSHFSCRETTQHTTSSKRRLESSGENLFKIRAETNCRTVVASPLSVRCWW